MFEGFPDGDGIDWADENNLPPPLEWWQFIIVVGVLSFIIWGVIDFFQHA